MTDLLTTAKMLARGNPWAYVVWLDGLSEREKTALHIQLGIDVFAQVAGMTVEIFRELLEAIRKAAEAIVEFMQTITRELYGRLLSLPFFRRRAFYLGLKRRWYVPEEAAWWIARHCPLRWLPAP